MIQEGFVDNHREVGGEAALSLEFADDGVVVVAELEPNVGREIFGVVIVDAVPPANRQSYMANRCEVLSVELFCVHAGAAWTRGQDSVGRRVGRSYPVQGREGTVVCGA